VSFLVSMMIIFQSISLHYSGDENTKKLLFSGTNQFIQVSNCKDNCVSIDVKDRKVTLTLKSQGESIKQKYDFSKNKVSEAQFADLLRLKIILFKKEYRKKIERRFIHLLKSEIETKIKYGIESKIKIELEEEIKTKIKPQLEEKIKSDPKSSKEL